MGVYDKIKSGVSSVSNAISAGSKETDSLGSELRARAEMNDNAQKAVSGFHGSDKPAPTGTPASPASGSGRYGDKAGEKRIDTSDMTKPLGSFKKGTTHVPKTGVYKLHEGEAVIPAEKNPMNAADAMSGIHSPKVPRKALKGMRVHATDNKKHIVTHEHHHPQHHPNTTHAFNSAAEVGQHVADNAPNIEPQAPSMDESGPAAPTPTPGM
jgi:hypothetical protein